MNLSTKPIKDANCFKIVQVSRNIAGDNRCYRNAPKLERTQTEELYSEANASAYYSKLCI